MTARAIRGNEAALELLERALALDRVAHAYAFVGPSGIGRKLTALAFAQTLLCPSRPRGEAGEAPRPRPLGGCGSCSPCRRVQAGTHPDCHLVLPDGQTIRIEQIRELERWASLRPREGPRKIFIVDEAERMPPVSANALLKTLEEPPDRTVLILILSQAKALPPTVLSRCQLVRFAPLPLADAVAVLGEHGVEEATARSLVAACQGRVGLAVGQAPHAWRERRDNAVALLSKVSAKGGEALFDSVEALGRDRAQAGELIEALLLWHRDLLCAKAASDPRLLISGDRQAELSLAAGATSWEAILEALVACREAWHALQGNVSPRLTLEVLLSRLALRAA
ncbi:MAG: DNA polymerase III subunit delta' [Candidatus Rokubacteria bacterium]|nr:DNA polymerase III subunit delta' [Candidatus Rokubacteria bacterium]